MRPIPPTKVPRAPHVDDLTRAEEPPKVQPASRPRVSILWGTAASAKRNMTPAGGSEDFSIESRV